MTLRPKNLPGDLIFAVCDLFFRGKDDKGKSLTTTAIAASLQAQGHDISRASIYRIVRIGVDRGYAKLCPPLNQVLRTRLKKRFPLADDVRVVDVKSPNNVLDSLADSAADLLLQLILKLDATRNPRGTLPEKRRRVHLGFGGGGTSLRVAQRLAQRLRAEALLPPITVHALSSGFDIERPLDAPSAFLSLFDELETVKIIGLFSAPFVVADHIERDRRMPQIDRALEFAKDVDIVVTSLAQSDDPHGLLNLFFKEYGSAEDHAYLASRRHRGDVLWQPYSDEEPLTEMSIRAFTLFDIRQLVKLSATRGKHVVAIAGPCVKCAETKEKALLPLLTRRELRVFNHLVTDSRTIEALLGPAEA